MAVQQHGIPQLFLADVLFDLRLRLIPGVDREKAETVLLILLYKCLEVRRLRTTGRSPDGPEADHHNVALVLGQGHFLSGQIG